MLQVQLGNLLHCLGLEAVYPVGINVFYSVVLWRLRRDIKSKPREILVEESPFAMLFQPYTSSLFFWEPIDATRRVMLTGFLVFFDEKLRITVALLVAMFFLLIHYHSLPYHSSYDNALSALANIEIVGLFLLLIF